MKHMLRSLTCILLGSLMSTRAGAATAPATQTIRARIDVAAPQWKQASDGLVDLSLEGHTMAGKPARPRLPQKTTFYALPPDADIATVEVTIENAQFSEAAVPGALRPESPLATSSADPVTSYGDAVNVVAGRDLAVYGANAFYPADIVVVDGYPQMRKWRMVQLTLSPVTYNPVAGRIRWLTSADLVISFEKQASGAQTSADASLANDRVLDADALDLIENKADGESWYGAGMQAQAETQPAGNVYVILTSDTIYNESPTLFGLVPHKQSCDYTVHVVTETKVNGNASATGWNEAAGQSPNGKAERIRQWLKNNYAGLGIHYVLLVGNPDPATGDVPMKRCYSYVGDTYDYPTDSFYCDLTGNWDLNGDGIFGTEGPDDGAGGVDFVPEVIVGRIPVYTATDWKPVFSNIVRKIIRYETEGDISWRKIALLPESWSDPYTDGAYVAEHMKSNYLQPKGYAAYTLYQQGNAPGHPEFNSSFWSCEDLRGDRVVNHWKNNSYGLVFWWAHGWSHGAAVHYDGSLFTSEQCWQLNNAKPAVVFMCSCTCGNPYYADNLSFEILKNGAIASVAAANVSWYYYCSWSPSEAPGMNASMGYNFQRYVVQNEATFGHAFHDMKAQISGWRNNKLTFNLYGDPGLSIVSRARDTDGDGMPDHWERANGLNPSSSSDASADTDGDGLTNLQEYQRGTNPRSADSDGDAMPDNWEVANQLDPVNAADAAQDPDNDWLTNAQEYQTGTLPRNPDFDGDTMPDGWEVTYSLDPKSAADASQDPDGDGYTNLQEFQRGSNPLVADPKRTNYTSMTAAGTFNGWNQAAKNMRLVADYTWQFDQSFANASGVRFKFVANTDWGINWGENNQGDFDPPMEGYGERGNYSDIRVNPTLNGNYRFTFNEQTGGYKVELIPAADTDQDGMPDAWETQYGLNPNNAADASQDPDGDGYTNLQEYRNGTNPKVAEPKKSNYSSMTAAGTFNGWNQAANNMQLIADYTWRGALNLSNASGVQFKFTANGNWNVNWGDNDQGDYDLPDITGTGEQTGKNIAINGTVSGTLTITFNEQTRQYTIQGSGPADTDQDGLPDAWETQYGLNPNNAADASQDPDGDGYTNLQEFQNGTNPIVAEPKKSNYSSMTAAGAFNGWNQAAKNMRLVADYTWQFDQSFANASGVRFKFVANTDWGINWGENNQGDFDPPMEGYGERGNYSDIRVNPTLNGNYRFTFNEQTGGYKVELIPAADTDQDGMPDAWETQYGLNPNNAADASQDPDGDGYTNLQEYRNGTNPKVAEPKKSNYSSMTAAGAFNGWNPAANNMTLVADYTWRATLNLVNATGVQFKFTANGNWNVNWGDNNQDDLAVPLTQTGERTGSNIRVDGTLNGSYVLTFNEQSAQYTLQAAP